MDLKLGTGPRLHGLHRVADYSTPDFRFEAFTNATAIQLVYSGLASVTWIRNEGKLWFTPRLANSESLFRTLVSASIPAALRVLSGDCVLHSSVVGFGGSAVAFVGGSGSGKSTLAAALCCNGATLVADDAALIRLGPNMTEAVAGNTTLRLRDGAAQLAALTNGKACPLSLDGRHEAKPVRVASSARLSALIFPEVRAGVDDCQLERLSPTEALGRVLAQPRVRGLFERELLRTQLANYAELLQRLPCYHALIPNRVEGCRDFVSDLWATVSDQKADLPAISGNAGQTPASPTVQSSGSKDAERVRPMPTPSQSPRC